MQKSYSTHDASRILKVHPFTVAKWIDRGNLKAWRTAGGHRRVEASDLRAYLVTQGLPVPRELDDVGGRLRLLVVDDDARALRATRRSFEPLDSEVVLTTTGSGVDAVLAIAGTRPEAVLIDLELSDLDAFEILREVRRRGALNAIVLVAITAGHTPEVAARALRAGAVACLAKPFNASSVLRQIRRASVERGDSRDSFDEWKALELRAKGRSVARIAEEIGRPAEWVTMLIASEARRLLEAGRPQAANAIEVGMKFHGGYRVREPGTMARTTLGRARGHSNRTPGPRGFASYAERGATFADARIGGRTLRAIGEDFGLTPERVRQILLQEALVLRENGQEERAALLSRSRP